MLLVIIKLDKYQYKLKFICFQKISNFIRNWILWILSNKHTCHNLLSNQLFKTWYLTIIHYLSKKSICCLCLTVNIWSLIWLSICFIKIINNPSDKFWTSEKVCVCLCVWWYSLIVIILWNVKCFCVILNLTLMKFNLDELRFHEMKHLEDKISR